MAVTELEIAQRAGVNVSTVSKILNKRPDSVFTPETVKRVFRIARELGFDFAKLKFTHSRRHPRKQISLPLELVIYDENGSLQQKGTAVLRDVSLSGAQLSGIVLPEQVVSLRPHVIGIRLLEGSLKDFELRCRPVRFLATDEGFDLGVEFLTLQPSELKRLRKIT